MCVHELPWALQRSQANWNRVGLPLQLPADALRVLPTFAWPEMAGPWSAFGVEATTPVGAENASIVPAGFVAETPASSVCPASAAAILYVCLVAPAIEAQLVPVAEQRSHWKANEVVAVFHVPA